jgi:hypothetical protein
MSLTPPERDETLAFEVTIQEDGETVHTAEFDTLEEAEMFVENWTDRVPHAVGQIEHRSHDHTAWEIVEADTALEQDYPTDVAGDRVAD